MNWTKPFLLSPVSKDYLWGGSRLNDDFNLGLASYPLAEAWVCSTHQDGPSRLSTGELLKDILTDHPEILGSHPLSITGGRSELPILIKLIDAKKDLSVQVHPDDVYAQREGQWGKTEMWYVLAAKPGSELVYGFNQDVTPDQVRETIGSGSIGELLNHVPVHKNDLFFVEPGTVHAIGEGILLAEIQQSSNPLRNVITYGGKC